MDKNEILEKSRKENRVQDEYAADVIKKSSIVGLVAVCAVCVILIFVEIIAGKEYNMGYGIIISVVNLVMWGYKGIKLKDKQYLFISAIFLVSSVFSCVSYFMGLFS